MLSSIVCSGVLLLAKPTKTVPWSLTVPYAVLRRSTWPKSSWSVRAACEVSGLGSSSMLSGLVRPITSAWAESSRAYQARESCAHCWSSHTAPPAPGEPSGTRA